jgi:sugar phosphate isomerase/epimerase
MNLSIASYSFHGLHAAGAIDLYGYLESCKYRYHLSTADIWNGMLPNPDPQILQKVKTALAERELALANLCVDGPHLWEDDPALRQDHDQGALAWLQAAAFLGARTLRIDAGGREDTWTAEQFDYIAGRYHAYAHFTHDHGFRVGPENHWGAEKNPENLKRLCEAVDHPGFGVLLHFRADPSEALLAPWAMHTHLSWAIGEDHLEESMSMLRSAGYTGCWSVEYHAGEHEYAAVAVQVARVCNMLSKM